MNISTFARRAGLSPSGVRWYEAAGIVPAPARRPNGYREYDEADLAATREHVDSFSDLPDAAAADSGRIVGRVERAVLALGDVGRVHLYRWGDGGAHFHVWLVPRPLGMVEANGAMLPLFEEVLPNVTDEELRAAVERVAAAM